MGFHYILNPPRIFGIHLKKVNILYLFVAEEMLSFVTDQGFSLASAIGHSPKIVPDVRDFAVQFGQFVRDDFRKHTLYGYAQ